MCFVKYYYGIGFQMEGIRFLVLKFSLKWNKRDIQLDFDFLLYPYFTYEWGMDSFVYQLHTNFLFEVLPFTIVSVLT